MHHSGFNCIHTLLLIPSPESWVPSEGAEEETKLTGDWLGPPWREESHCDAAEDDIGLSEREDGASRVRGENLRWPGLGGNWVIGGAPASICCWAVIPPLPPFAIDDG